MRTSRLPMAFFDRNPAGRIITRFSSDYNSIFRIFGGPLAEFIGLIFDLTAMTILISVASLWLLPIWILQGLLNYVVYRLHLARLGLVAFGAGGFKARLDIGDGRFQLIDRNRHVLGQRRHSSYPFTERGGTPTGTSRRGSSRIISSRTRQGQRP